MLKLISCSQLFYSDHDGFMKSVILQILWCTGPIKTCNLHVVAINIFTVCEIALNNVFLLHLFQKTPQTWRHHDKWKRSNYDGFELASCPDLFELISNVLRFVSCPLCSHKIWCTAFCQVIFLPLVAAANEHFRLNISFSHPKVTPHCQNISEIKFFDLIYICMITKQHQDFIQQG